MMHVLASVLGFSLDTFLVCLGIGWQVRSWRERFRLALIFGMCDAMATALGSLWYYRLPELTTWAIYLLCAFLFGQAVRSRSAVVYALPVLLSLDNLFGGIPAGMAPVMGLGSTVIGLLGLSLAAAGQHALGARESEA